MKPQAQRGVTAVMTAILLTTLFAVLALVWNVGHLLSVRAEMQNGLDAAAMAGASRLNGTPERLAQARQAANDFAAQHLTDGQDPVTLSATAGGGPVVFGSWNRRTRTFTPIAGNTVADARLINAVRANGARNESVWLRPFLNAAQETSVGTLATAVTGGLGRISCNTAPLVIRAPCLLNEEGGLKCTDPPLEYIMALSPAGDDTAGLTNLIPLSYSDIRGNGSASASSICQSFKEGPAPDCTIDAGLSYLETTNGNEISAKCDDITTDDVDEKICNWFKQFAPKNGQPPTPLPIPIVRFLQDNQPDSCDGQYGGVAEVVGFAAFEITGVYCKGDEGQRTGPCQPFATKQCVSARYVCNVDLPDSGGPPGGEWWGTNAVPPQLAE